MVCNRLAAFERCGEMKDHDQSNVQDVKHENVLSRRHLNVSYLSSGEDSDVSHTIQRFIC